jgi:mycothiol synthase
VAERIETVDRLDETRRALVDALIGEATAIDGVPPVGEHKYLKLRTGGGPARALLAYDGDRLAGYAQFLPAGAAATAELVVRPGSRGKGVAGRLIAAARGLAVRAGARELKLWAYGAEAPGAAVATRRGLSVGRTLLQLERPLDALPPRPDLAGYRVRPFDPTRDAETWLHLHNAVFADHPENGRWSPDDLRARLLQPWFRAEDFLIAEAGGRMVGFNWLKRRPDAGVAPAGGPPDRPEGEIYIIGVAGSERGRGLGRGLAILGLHHLRERGMRVCTLYVEGDNGPALGLYRTLGFVVRQVHRCYTLPLVPADEPAPRTAPAAAPRPALAPCP